MFPKLSTVFANSRSAAAGLLALSLLLASGCTTMVDIKFTVASEPAGAYTVMQIQPYNDVPTDWAHLGMTPLVTVRKIDEDMLEDAISVTMKVMKDGYLEQTKVWSGQQFIDEYERKGGIFWSPRLVPTAAPK